MEEISEISQESKQDALYHRQEVRLALLNQEDQEDPGEIF